MFRVIKGDRTMTLHDGVQVAAFEKSGWELAPAAGSPARAAPSKEPEPMDTLKAEADALGITYHPNIGVEKLKAKIDEARAAKNAEDAEGAD